MKTLLRIIRDESRNWWYHAQLRRQGNHTEARTRENAHTAGVLKNLRDAKATGGYFSVGRGGYSLRIGEIKNAHGSSSYTVSGYGKGEYLREACRRLGILIIDTTVIPDKVITETIRIPMAAIGIRPADPARDDGSYGSLAYAPLPYVVERYRALGAAIENG